MTRRPKDREVHQQNQGDRKPYTKRESEVAPRKEGLVTYTPPAGKGKEKEIDVPAPAPPSKSWADLLKESKPAVQEKKAEKPAPAPVAPGMYCNNC